MIRIIRLQQYASLTRRISRYFGLFKFPLPDLGEKIKEGTVKKLYVREGDRVAEFDKLADVESDKQFTEITAPEEGIIKKLHYKEDQTCQVGHIFLEIETNSPHSDPQPTKPQQTSEPVKVQPPKQVLQDKSEVLASATVKMWARQHKIDLQEVSGTGKKGRVLKQDIINYIQNSKNPPLKAKILKQPTKTVPSAVTKAKMTQTQQLMQRLATYSSTIPHLFLHQSFDVTELSSMIESTKTKTTKISLMSILIKSFSLALTLHPKMNSLYPLSNQFGFNRAAEQNILLPRYTSKGLSFSVIQNLQNLSIQGIQSKMQSEGDREISAAMLKEMIGKSTICLSDIGEIGGMTMNPLIFGEMVCHVSVGEVRDVAISKNGKQQRRQYANITMGADHRVLDGASCARFTSTWKQFSENPNKAFLQMI